MPHHKYIAIILVYRNVDDLKECVASFQQHIPNCKMIVVNSFYDDKSNALIKQTAQQLGCDFLSVENKGYGTGNNAGIAYARKNYTFDYIIISNPDIIIQQFDDKQVNPHGITAPDITTLKGKKQNPLLPWDTHLLFYFAYQGYKRNNRWLCIITWGINKILREMFLLYKRIFTGTCKVYGAHGSFLILSQSALLQLTPLYDENIFLFYEELVLAKRAKELKIPTLFVPKIKILHKEDGSMKLSNFSLNKETAKASMYYYEHYVKER